MKMGWYTCHSKYKWSQDNSVEIEKGWIIRAETISELAGKIGIKTDLLEKSITTYNQYCDTGVDPEFARPKENWLK
jgi:hypothetical protein